MGMDLCTPLFFSRCSLAFISHLKMNFLIHWVFSFDHVRLLIMKREKDNGWYTLSRVNTSIYF
jgi:hypothetical protein